MVPGVQHEASKLGIALSGYIAQMVSAARLLQTAITTTNANNIPKWARQESGTLGAHWKLITFESPTSRS